MASITKRNNSIIIQCDNATNPATISDWSDGKVTYSDDHLALTFGNQGFMFGAWDVTPSGELTEINGVDVSASTNEEKALLIQNNVLTEDQFSGTPVIISDTTMVAGQFTAIEVLEAAILDVSDGDATVEVDGEGNAIDVSGYATIVLPAGGTPIYGKFTQIKLVSGTVKAYSNL